MSPILPERNSPSPSRATSLGDELDGLQSPVTELSFAVANEDINGTMTMDMDLIDHSDPEKHDTVDPDDCSRTVRSFGSFEAYAPKKSRHIRAESCVSDTSSIQESTTGSKSEFMSKLIRRRRESDSGASATYSIRKSMWTKLIDDKDVWSESDKEIDIKIGPLKRITRHLRIQSLKLRLKVSQAANILKRHPWIIVATAITFTFILLAGVFLVLELANKEAETKRGEAQELAALSGDWFADALDRALLPLFTLSQFVRQPEMFATLPEEMGPAFNSKSLPFLPPNVSGGFMRRNMTGTSCTDPEKIERFEKIASSIKEDAKMEGILVNLQVAPLAVVCYAYPLVNTEDFEPPKVLNSSGIIGLDNLSEPRRVASAERTMLSDGVVIAGPLSLGQCSEDCDFAVKKAFIAWLPIDSLNEKQTISIQGVDHNKWGFATAIINWAELVHRSKIDGRFVSRGMKYQLTRTDDVFDAELEKVDTKVTLLAGEEVFEMNDGDYVSVEVDTSNGVWNIKVGFEEGTEPTWKNGAIAAAVIGAFIISCMFMIICIQGQSHHDLLKDMLPPQALRKIEQGKTCVEKYNIATVFFSDIVGYTTMSANMSAIQVMKTLNEFYTEVDKIADKYHVCKIQTIGDAYMVTGGVPNRCLGPEGATNVALFAIEFLEFAKTFKTSDGGQINIRAGINSGPLVAGVVGIKRPQYTVFGDTVNSAARMESTSETMRIQCTGMTCELLRDSKTHAFLLEKRGNISVKGKGRMNTWYINGTADIPEGEDPRPKEELEEMKVSDIESQMYDELDLYDGDYIDICI